MKLLYNIFQKSRKSYVTYCKEHCNNIKENAQLNINGRIIDVPKKVVNEVNNYFVNVGPNTENEVPKLPKIVP